MTQPTIDLATFDELQETAGAEFVARAGRHVPRRGAADAGRPRRARWRRGDADRFRRAAHSLKSNSNTFGALALGAMARELELAGLDHALAAGTARRSTRWPRSTRAWPRR